MFGNNHKKLSRILYGLYNYIPLVHTLKQTNVVALITFWYFAKPWKANCNINPIKEIRESHHCGQTNSTLTSIAPNTTLLNINLTNFAG